MWCKGFSFPDQWDIERIHDTTNLPRSLVVLLVGSQKPILFCEGDDKASLDHQLLEKLFSSEFTIIPVGTSTNVREYLHAYNSSILSGNKKAVGVIDGDMKLQEEIEVLQERNVFVLPFNEVEMFFLCEDIILSALQVNYGETESTRILNEFREKLFGLFSTARTEIARIIVKTQMDKKFACYRLEAFDSLEKLKKQHLELIQININDIYADALQRIDDIVQRRDYEGMLRMCPLKGRVSGSFTEKELGKDYIKRALYRISCEDDLRNNLRNKFFAPLLRVHSS